RAAGAVRDPATRDALVSLTETARDRVAAWDALASWASSHGDVAVWSRALQTLVKIAPARRDSVAQSAEELAGAGQIGEARAVAAAAVEAGDEPFNGDGHALAARLAVDEAIASGRASAVTLRSTRARVGLEEAGARALLAGQKDLAHAIVAGLTAADPGASGARMVLAASDGRDVVGAAWEVRRHGAQASAATLVAFGLATGHGVSPQDARATLAAVVHGPPVLGDDRVVRAAVELVTRGALDASVLPPDGLVELAALRGQGAGKSTNVNEAVGAGVGVGVRPSLPDLRVLDARHEYLAAALSDPKGDHARELGARLASVVGSDPVVAAAAALVQIGTGAPIDAGAPRALLMRDPRDPLLAAIALRLATKTGDTAVASQARESLATF
ncbi:MAG TPA: hypothetical protein VH044_14735, partial [Polyangiaceae bacterium]|nr:hypothetical protein [Polyangiaceae bacterium]